MVEHVLHEAIEHRLKHAALKVLVVGAGGTGSKVVAGLRFLHQALLAFGRRGLTVTLADGDLVSESNLVRQAYYAPDLGRNKAETLIGRINLSCGLDWKAVNRHVDHGLVRSERADIVIACVDSRAARAEISQGLENSVYFVDAGNSATTAQVVLGSPENWYNPRRRLRLRTAYELFPELCDAALPETDEPSCGTLEALAKQDLFVNDVVATHTLNLLWQLLNLGRLDHHGVFIDLKTSSTRPLLIDPEMWRRFQRQGRRRASSP